MVVNLLLWSYFLYSQTIKLACWIVLIVNRWLKITLGKWQTKPVWQHSHSVRKIYTSIAFVKHFIYDVIVLEQTTVKLIDVSFNTWKKTLNTYFYLQKKTLFSQHEFVSNLKSNIIATNANRAAQLWQMLYSGCTETTGWPATRMDPSKISCYPGNN